MRIIGGKFKGHPLLSPKTSHTRPTSSRLRESLFNILQGEIEGALFLDLFAGSGAVGLEALSRGALHATFIDTHTKILCKNIAQIEAKTHTTVMGQDVFKALPYLAQQGEMFDIIFADPPYGYGLSAKVLEFVDTHSLLKPEGTLILEDTTEPKQKPQTLKCLSKRKVGNTLLLQYRRV